MSDIPKTPVNYFSKTRGRVAMLEYRWRYIVQKLLRSREIDIAKFWGAIAFSAPPCTEWSQANFKMIANVAHNAHPFDRAKK